MKKLKVVIALLALVLIFGLTSCQSALQVDAGKSNLALERLQKAKVGYTVEYFTTAKAKEDADRLLDQPDLVGTAVVTDNGVLISYFKTFGACYPNSIQATNPLQHVGTGAVIAQVEPSTGLYPPSQSDGTICVTTTGGVIRPEQKVFWSSLSLKIATAPMVVLQPEEGGRVNVEAVIKAAKAFKAKQDQNKPQ